MADNSQGGQYVVNDPTQTTDGNVSITGTTGPAPTPDGQMPPQPSAQPAAPAPQPSAPAPDAQAPQPSAPADKQAPAPQAPIAPPVPKTRTQSFLERARQISDDMVGGDPYKTSIDPHTGETTRIRQPLNARAISMSLVLEALEGGIAGAGAKGTNAVGEAAQAGLQKGEQISQQKQAAQQQQDAQAQQDLRTRQQVISNLLQTRQLAMSLGRQSLDEAQESVKSDADKWARAQENPQDIISKDLGHDDAYAMVNKLPMGTAQVVITGAHPRTDPKTGAPVYQLPSGQIVDKETDGAYQAPDFTYAVVKPESKIGITDANGELDEQHKGAQKYGFSNLTAGSSGKYPPNYQITQTADQAMTNGYKIATAMQTDVNKGRAAAGLDPLDIAGDMKQDSTVRNAALQYNGVISSGGSHADAIKAVLAGKWSGAAGTIANWYGGPDATKLLDAHRDTINFDNGVKHGDITLQTRDDAQRALGSNDPAVKALGKKKFAELDAIDAHQASTKAFAAEAARVWGESKIAQVKSDLAGTASGADNPNFNETPNPSTGLRENYINSLGDGDLVRNIIAGIKDPPNIRTTAGKKLAAEVAQATQGKYDDTKYFAYKKLRQDFLPGGKTGSALTAASTAMDHLASAVDHAKLVSTLPVIGAMGGKGVFGKENQSQYNSFELERGVAASELGKAVESKVLTQGEADDWHNKLMSWTPAEFHSKAVPLAKLLQARVKEAQATAQEASPAGIVTGLKVISKKGLESYNRITGENEQLKDYLADNDQARSTQLAQPIPQALPGKVQFSPSTNTYWVGGKQTDEKGIPIQ